MSTEELLGLWYCELVDQEQSDDEAEEFGDYDHFDRPPQKAAATEFATTTIELREDGTYRLEGPEWGSSHGTWSKSDGLALREAEDSSNGFDGLEYAHHSGERLVVAVARRPEHHPELAQLSFEPCELVLDLVHTTVFCERISGGCGVGHRLGRAWGGTAGATKHQEHVHGMQLGASHGAPPSSRSSNNRFISSACS